MGRFANPACYGARQQQRKQQQAPHKCRLLGRGSTGPIRRLFSGPQTSSRGSQHLTEAPQITTTVNSDGSVTGMVTLPKGVQPHDINFRTTTTHNGKARNYTVNLPRGKASSEFFDTRNKTNFCKMSSTRNSDGRHTVSFTLYSQATNATLFIPKHASQSFSRLESIANQSGKETERITGEALENTPVQSIETSKNKDGSITGVVHLTPEQAKAKIDFEVTKINGSSRSKIQSSLDKCTLSARVDGFYDVRRTVKPDGSAILSMTLPPGDLTGKISIGGRDFTLSADSIPVEKDLESLKNAPDESDPVVDKQKKSSTAEQQAPQRVSESKEQADKAALPNVETAVAEKSPTTLAQTDESVTILEPQPKSEEPSSPSDSIADSGSVRVEKATQGEAHLSKASNVDFVYAWTPPKDHHGSGIYPIADASKVDVSSGSTGLHSPAGVGLDGHYRVLRTVNTVGREPMPVILMHTPSAESRSRVEQLVSRAMPAHVVHYDNAIRFNKTAPVSGELPSNLRYYQHSQVRSDGSMLFSRTPDISAPGADLHIAAPRFRNNALEQWDWISVELKADGSVTRKKYGN
jgi:hypothetical protein